ncbi:MAG: hydroxyacid dehydrogenase [Planctomycetia bacterium]|nr:hydroxyacid dehydrogenase [Planctomycetia bacterium]
MNNKILTSPSSFGQISSEPFEILRKIGYGIVNNPFGRKLTEDEVIKLAKDCIGIVAGVEPLTAKVMDALPKLECISRVGVGLESVDLGQAKENGIIVVNTPDGPTRSVAEFTIAMTFSLLRRIPHADSNFKKYIWKKETGNLLYKKQIGIIGLGRIGKMVSEMFKALGNPVMGYDLHPDEIWAKEQQVELKDFHSVLRESDIVSLHVPGNKEKIPIIKSQEIELMKTDALLINLARGDVVEEDALYDALLKSKIAGAAIDVFSEEPYNGPLCKLDNVVLTPHLGSYAKEGKLQMEIDAVNNLVSALERNKDV